MDTTTLGTRAVLWGTIGEELIGVVYDLRYMVICSIALILADLWWGYSESKKRLEEAKEMNSPALQDKYKWHKSRAGRRTCNKIVDYLTYLIVGALLGMAITEPMGICDHTTAAAMGLGIGGACEVASIIGHVAYVKMGVEVAIVDAWRSVIKFFGRMIKSSSHEIGEAVEQIGKEKGEETTLEPVEG